MRIALEIVHLKLISYIPKGTLSMYIPNPSMYVFHTPLQVAVSQIVMFPFSITGSGTDLSSFIYRAQFIAILLIKNETVVEDYFQGFRIELLTLWGLRSGRIRSRP
jgi:hypothetical protein